jgi:hypothetical protein
MRLFSYLRRRPDDRPFLHSAVGCRRAWTWTDIRRLGGTTLLAAALMQFAIWTLFAEASAPGVVCATFWSGGPNPPFKELVFTEDSCDGSGHMVIGRSGKCFYNANTGNCKCYLPDLITETPAPAGWTCDFQISGNVGSCVNGCATGPACTGSCYWYQTYDDNKSYSDPTAWTTTLSSSTCSTGCSCAGTAPSGYGWGSATVACVKTVVSSPCDGHGGDADHDGCCADVDCDDNDPTKCPPEQCNPGPPPCSGNCSYVSISDGNGNSFKWSLESNTCTAGAANCSCPASPGGACPGSAGMHTSLSCGSTGAVTCIPNCTGSCNYVGVVKSDNTGFKWQLTTNNCNASAPNCGCPADPGGNCPKGEGETRSGVACGSSSAACTQGPCATRGGDQDGDGCCKDVDCDDNDRTICLSCCKGSCTFKWVVAPCKTASMTYRWDGDRWKWSSGDCGRPDLQRRMSTEPQSWRLGQDREQLRLER